MIQTMLHGLSMALADSVPGVSGGTIAFIMGFYEQFLTAIHQFFGKDRALRKDAARYLVKFAVGWCMGMGASVLVLSHVFENHIYFMSSLFLGLTVAAIPFILHEEQESLKGKYYNVIFTILGAVLVISLTVFRAEAGTIGTISFQSLSILQYGYLVVSGVFAISAMLLPGVSGSTLLLILGVYIPTIHAVKEVLHLHMQYLPGILALAAGVAIGVVFAAKIIRKALCNFRSQMVYLILGLMIGSLYAILMGPTTLDIPKPPVDFSSFSIIAFVIGVVILGGLEWIRQRTAQKEDTLPSLGNQ